MIIRFLLLHKLHFESFCRAMKNDRSMMQLNVIYGHTGKNKVNKYIIMTFSCAFNARKIKGN